jgi:hypothetical protein
MLQYAEIRLAEFVNEKSDYDEEHGEGTCYPGLKKLSAALGLKMRQTIKLLQRLEATGEVEIIRKRGAGNLYHIRPGASALQCRGAQKDTRAVHSSAPDPCTPVHGGSALFGSPSITLEINSRIN